MILLISRMLNSEGSCIIMIMNCLTQGLKDTSHLKTIRLIGFMQDYVDEQFNSRTSWVTCNSIMVRIIISKVIKNFILKTWNFKILLSMIFNLWGPCGIYGYERLDSKVYITTWNSYVRFLSFSYLLPQNFVETNSRS